MFSLYNEWMRAKMITLYLYNENEAWIMLYQITLQDDIFTKIKSPDKIIKTYHIDQMVLIKKVEIIGRMKCC